MMEKQEVMQISNAIGAVRGIEVKNFYFVACGGSMASLYPGHYIFERETEIPNSIYTSNEFIHQSPKGLGKNSVVIVCSHSGNTPETVEAAKFAREKGALTIALSNLVDSPLWKESEYAISYQWGPDSEAYNGKDSIFYRLLFGILNEVSPNGKYEKALESLKGIQRILDVNKEKTFDQADEFGKKYKRAELIYTLASGPNYGAAYSFSSCFLMEMLWINSNAIHSGEFFHGPFEITDYDVPFLIIKGLGETRPLDARAEKFANKFSNEVHVVDVNDFEMDGIDEELRGYFAPIVLGVVLRQYADGLAEHTGHPLSVRRYMWKMDY